jgi:hypothetical protein
MENGTHAYWLLLCRKKNLWILFQKTPKFSGLDSLSRHDLDSKGRLKAATTEFFERRGDAWTRADTRGLHGSDSDSSNEQRQRRDHPDGLRAI